MGAYTTYDLSTFADNQVDDLRPGHWLTFSHAQLADLNNAVAAGTAEFMAKGNIYNALLYHGDVRSEVSNLITGDGNDTLIGNEVDNFLSAKAGNDIIVAGAGNDVISGGAGLDTVFFGTGHDVLRDSLADMNGDITAGMSFDSSLDVWGVRFGHDSIAIAADGRSATLSTEGASVQLNGDFVGGDFLMAARGIGAAAHTDVSFVQFLPSLSEGVSVAATAVNGIASQPFLTGDGAVRFTLDFKSAVSAFSNELGYYKIGADGTIHDVHILFGNTLNVPAGQQTIDLGTPGANERIGFFLVQDGFDFYGRLPDDLSFTAPGSNAAANLAAGLPPVLHSASLGTLTRRADLPLLRRPQCERRRPGPVRTDVGRSPAHDRLRGYAARNRRQRFPGRGDRHPRHAGRQPDRLNGVRPDGTACGSIQPDRRFTRTRVPRAGP